MTYPTYGPVIPTPSPGYEPIGSWAPPPPLRPRKRSRTLLWSLSALLSLMVAALSAVLLLQDHPSRTVADPPAQSEPPGVDSPPPHPRPVPGPPSDCLVECTQAPAEDGTETGAGVHYGGSVDAAAAFVQDIANGDMSSAHDALCGAGKNRFPTPDELIADFYSTFGITEITGASLTDVYPADDVADAVVFDLQTDAGDVTAAVYVVEEASSLTVCGYDVAG